MPARVGASCAEVHSGLRQENASSSGAKKSVSIQRNGKRGRLNGFRSVATVRTVARTAAIVLRPGGASAPPRLDRARGYQARSRAFHGRSAAKGARGGIVESRASRTRI